MKLEKMDEFFNKRAGTYDSHMLEDLKLDEFYEAIAALFDNAHDGMRLLDLGCGTGLELERLYTRYPNMEVTGIDLSQFSEEQKLVIYKKVYSTLVSGGAYIEGDYTVDSLEKQEFYITENERLRNEDGITDGFFHYNTPLTAATQMKLLTLAGFSDVRLVRQRENTCIIKARK